VHPARTDHSTVPFLTAIREICEEIEPLVGSQVNFATRIDGESGPQISKSDAYQVLSNLVSNAIFAMPGQGQLLIEGYQEPTGAFCVRVTDSGQGMSTDVAERALEPFFTTKPVGSGTGLGLATVAAIIERWRGTIKIDSAPEMGTRITISVPEKLDPMCKNGDRTFISSQAEQPQ
jgi:signal transduction histidine kinase